MPSYLATAERLSRLEIESFAESIKPTSQKRKQYRLHHPQLWWNNLSNLQKAVRRGDVDQALMSAERLYRQDSAKLLRRLSVIALEDLAFGDLLLVAAVLEYGARSRKQASHGSQDLGKCLALVEHMARATKDRSACELAVAAIDPPAWKPRIARFARTRPTEWVRLYASEQADIRMRSLAGLALGGTLTLDNRRVGSPDKEALAAAIQAMDLPEVVVVIIENALRFGGEVAALAVNIPVLYARMRAAPVVVSANRLPDGELIEGLLSPAYDKHTRVGLRALARYRTRCRELWEFLRDIGADGRRVIGNLAFMAEGSVVDREIRCQLGDELSAMNEQAQCVAIGLPYSALPEAKRLYLDNLAILNEFRRSAAASEVTALNG
jgi:hypothetical protein